jgi:hypothetical protein
MTTITRTATAMILAPGPLMIVPVMIAIQAMEISLDPIVIAIQVTEISLDPIVMAIQAMEISSILALTREEMDGIVVTVVGMAVMEVTDGMVVTVVGTAVIVIGNMIKLNLESLSICLGKFHDYTDSWV